MPLIDIVKDLEGISSGMRKDVVCLMLDELGLNFRKERYNSGENVVVCSGKKKEIGIGSHFDVVSGSPGANDNASAIAVSLDVLKRVKEKPLKNIGVRGLIFDEEEYSLKGSRAYVKSGGTEGLIGFYNMELVGSGNKVAVWSEEKLHEGLLLNTFEVQARALGVEVYRFPYLSKILQNSGDHLSFSEAGFKEAFCITTIDEEDLDIAAKYLFNPEQTVNIDESLSKSHLFRHYHKPTDSSAHLNEKTLQMVSDLLYNSICEIDRISK